MCGVCGWVDRVPLALVFLLELFGVVFNIDLFQTLIFVRAFSFSFVVAFWGAPCLVFVVVVCDVSVSSVLAPPRVSDVFSFSHIFRFHLSNGHNLPGMIKVDGG